MPEVRNRVVQVGRFGDDLERPRVAERISFDEVIEAHRRLEAGGLNGKLVLCPDLPSRPDQAAADIA